VRERERERDEGEGLTQQHEGMRRGVECMLTIARVIPPDGWVVLRAVNGIPYPVLDALDSSRHLL
jgi:hypothetical protein